MQDEDVEGVKAIIVEGTFANAYLCLDINAVPGTNAKPTGLCRVIGRNEFRLRALRDELQLYNTFRHPNIYSFLHAAEFNNRLYLIYPYCPDTLRERVAKHGPFAEEESREILSGIAQGLECLHERGVHYAVFCPTHILCTAEKSHFQVKLTLFESSSLSCEDDARALVARNINFAAPEVVAGLDTGKISSSPASDVWGFGVIGYILLNHGFPFATPTDTFASMVRERKLPFLDGLQAREFITSLLVANPEKRPQIKEVLHHPWMMIHK